ncbi:MAG: hypothetical protein HC851_19590 [Acaryochloris sp. RU_4_1]|nr:hypothetical protein [Acaryochloris sp. RU_4_1]NJR57168.1 hypothetical protein [Acaryochloris sp. CRU_2_0]
MTINEIQELLNVEDDILGQILDACGWTELNEFTDAQVSTLESIVKQHDEKDRDYLDAYLRNIASNAEISGTQYNEIVEAITQAGGTSLDYRDRFKFICTQVKEGVTPADAITGTNQGKKTVDEIAGDYIQYLRDEGLLDQAAEQALDAIPDFVSQRQLGVVAAGLNRFDERIREILTDPNSNYRKRMEAVVNGEVLSQELKKLSLNPMSKISLKPANSSSTNSTST